jgi:hypothetical protein
MWRHISAHGATTKYSSNSFAFKTKIEKEGLPRDSTPDLETSAQRPVGKRTHLPGEQVCRRGNTQHMITEQRHYSGAEREKA